MCGNFSKVLNIWTFGSNRFPCPRSRTDIPDELGDAFDRLPVDEPRVTGVGSERACRERLALAAGAEVTAVID
jgi:hypothetical protein